MFNIYVHNEALLEMERANYHRPLTVLVTCVVTYRSTLLLNIKNAFNVMWVILGPTHAAVTRSLIILELNSYCRKPASWIGTNITSVYDGSILYLTLYKNPTPDSVELRPPSLGNIIMLMEMYIRWNLEFYLSMEKWIFYNMFCTLLCF